MPSKPLLYAVAFFIAALVPLYSMGAEPQFSYRTTVYTFWVPSPESCKGLTEDAKKELSCDDEGEKGQEFRDRVLATPYTDLIWHKEVYNHKGRMASGHRYRVTTRRGFISLKALTALLADVYDCPLVITVTEGTVFRAPPYKIKLWKDENPEFEVPETQ